MSSFKAKATIFKNIYKNTSLALVVKEQLSSTLSTVRMSSYGAYIFVTINARALNWHSN